MHVFMCESRCVQRSCVHVSKQERAREFQLAFLSTCGFKCVLIEVCVS